MSPFFDGSTAQLQLCLAVGGDAAGIAYPAGSADDFAQPGCPHTAFAGTEYGDFGLHQRTFRVTMVTTASRMPTIQKRAVILLSGMPPFW